MTTHFDRHAENMEMTCDSCGESGEFYCTDFMEGIEQFKEDGWKIEHVDGDWEHTCPDCLNKPMEEKI